MRLTVLLTFVASFGGFAPGQQAPDPPTCNSYIVQKTISEKPLDLSFKQRFCIYGGKLISGQAFFGPIFLGGVAQLRNDPMEWGQGTKGYLRRIGTRYAQGAAKSTAEFAFGNLLREDPRYEPSTSKSFWKRTGHALSTVVVVDHLGGGKWPALSKMAGATSSGVVGLSWYPQRLNTPGQVLSRTGSAYGGYVASAVFAEFQADIFRLLGKLVGSDRSVPSSQPLKPRGMQ